MKEGNVVQQRGLYRSEFEHDNCGIGAIVNIKGQKSHDTVANALKIVENLEHRAGKDAEGKTGDGVGILLQISHKFFTNVCRPLGIFLGSERDYGVGMFFFPQDELKKNQAKKIFEVIVKNEGMNFLGWREVPVKADVLGSRAVECMPCIMQAFIERIDIFPERRKDGNWIQDIKFQFPVPIIKEGKEVVQIKGISLDKEKSDEHMISLEKLSTLGTVVLLFQLKQKPDDYINVTIELDDVDITSAETKATYDEIKKPIGILQGKSLPKILRQNKYVTKRKNS